jgi:NAD(P)-dependent dehydrogenase (short-subunit alcohol dehydrogenase family)
VDVLINSAGNDYPGSIEELTAEQWNKVIGVNLNGYFIHQNLFYTYEGSKTQDTS